MQIVLHGNPIEYLVRANFIVESRGHNVNQVAWLSIQSILLVSNLHDWGLILQKRIKIRFGKVLRSDHLITKHWFWLEFLVQWLVEFIQKDTQWDFVLLSTVQINEPFGGCFEPQQ